MTSPLDVSDGADGVVAVSDSPKVLRAIRKPGWAAALWRRKPPRRFQNWIDNVASDRLPEARVVLRADLVCEALINGASLVASRDVQSVTYLPTMRQRSPQYSPT